MEHFLIKGAQLVLALMILIIIHEFGHFLFARIFGVRNEKFYLFFNPRFSLFKWKPGKHISVLNKTKFLSDEGKEEYEADMRFEKAVSAYYEAEQNYSKLKEHSEKVAAKEKLDRLKEEYNKEFRLAIDRQRAEYDKEKGESWWRRMWSHTLYGIGWLPLGGYCKIAGMIDESMDTEQLKQPAQPWEFRSKPAWQRLLIMIAGVLFNFLLAILIYAGIVYATGEKYIPLDKAEMGMVYSGEARKAGFRNGDRILLIDGEAPDSPATDRMRILQAREVTLLRDGDTVVLPIPKDLIFRLDEEAKSDTAPAYAMMAYRLPTVITQVVPGEGAARGGVKEGDRVLRVDSLDAVPLDLFLEALPSRAGKEIQLTVERQNGQTTDTLTLPVKLNENAKMGVGLEIDPSKFFDTKEIHYNLFSSIPRGIKMGVDRMTAYASSMKLVFTKEGAKSVGGFGSIGAIFPEKWDWIAFWNIAAFLSVALAFMNFLPIPALDGGHILFLVIEIIIRRPLPQKFLEYAQQAGMVLLLALLLYANGMDIFRLFVK
ncbi:MAG: RIP metalloprotease RseP [Bacteroides sp.]|nr:RIP metalloprotease RseP [Bacteroides sp.]